MPAPSLSFDQVYDAYRKSGSEQSLGDWSAFANDVTGSDAYSQGRQSLIPGLLKKGSYWIDQALESTGLPEKAGEFGASVFDFFGGDPEYGREIGRELPRGAVDMAPMFIPYVGPALRLGGAGALMAGHTYADTDSIGRAAVSAATPFIGAAGGQTGINALAKTPLVNPVVRTMEMLTKAGNPTGRLVSSAALEGVKDKTLGYLAQQTGAMAAMEATGYATEAIASETWNPYEGRSVRDWALGTVLGQIPYMAQDLVGLATRPMLVGKTTPVYKAPPSEKAPEVDISNITPADAMRRSFDLDKSRAVAEAMKIDEPERRQAAIEDALAMHEYKNDFLDGKTPSIALKLWADPNVQETKTIYDRLLQLKSTPPEQRDQFIVNDGIRELRQRMLSFRDRDHNEITTEQHLAEIVAETEILDGAADQLIVPEGFDPGSGKVVLDSASEMRDEVSDVLMQNGAGAEEAVVDAAVGVRNASVAEGQRKVRASDMSKANEFETVSRRPKDELEQAGVNEVLQLMRASSGSEVEPKRLINAWYNWRERLATGGREGVDPIADLKGILGRVVTRARLPKQLEASRFERDASGKAVGFADRAQAQAYADNLNKGLAEDSPFTYSAYSDAGRNGPGADTPFGVKRKYRSEADRKIHEAERGAKEEAVVAEVKETVEVLTDKSTDPDAKMARLVARQSLAKFLSENGRELGLDEAKLTVIFGKVKSGAVDALEMERALAKMLAAKREDAFFADREEEEFDNPDYAAARKFSASAGQGFRFKLGDVFSEDDGGRILVGSKVVGKGGMVPEAVFNSQVGGRVSKDELALWKMLVPKAWSDKGVQVSFLRNELEKLPQLETRVLDVGNEETKFGDPAGLEHTLETLGYAPIYDDNGFPHRVQSRDGIQHRLTDLPEGSQVRQTLQTLQRTIENDGVESSPESATARFSTVNPWPLDVLQGKREIAPGHKVVWSGDLSLNTPVEERLVVMGDGVSLIVDGEPATEVVPKFVSGHYPSAAGQNQLAFVRGAIHEYQPGAKLPDGTTADKIRRVMEVWEVQSDWASSHKRDTDRILADQKQYEQYLQHAKDNNLSYVERMPDEVDSWKKGLETPTALLPHWESLAYKAALNHALASGADSIVLSDAESAMMTEGHDKYAAPVVGPDSRVWDSPQRKPQPGDWVSTDNPYWVYPTKELAQKNTLPEYSSTLRQLTPEDFLPQVSQASGMRAAYDQRGPNILKKLTGETGREVELGIHENALKDSSTGERANLDDIRADEAWLRSSGGDLSSLQGSPVFRDAQGRPKLSNTGRLFDLTKLQADRAAQGISDFPLVGAKKRGSGTDPELKQPSIMPSPEETLREVIKLSGGNASEQDLFGRFLSEVFNLGRIPHQKLGVIINNDPKNQIWGLGNRSAGGNRMAWLAPADTELTPKTAREMGIALMHETGHVIEGAIRGGFAPREVLRSNEVFMNFLKSRPEKAMEFFRMWRDQLPKDYHNLQSLNEMLDGSAYAKQAHELYATGMALWSADQMKTAEAKAWGVLAPPEAKSWFKELTKYAHRMIGALRSAVFMRKGAVTPEFKQSLDAVRDMYAATVKGIREAEVSMENLRSWAENGTEDVWAFQTKGKKFYGFDKAGAMKTFEGDQKEVGAAEKIWNEAIRTLDGLGRQLPVFNRVVAQVHRHATNISRDRNQIMGAVVGGINPDTGTMSMSGPEYKMHQMVLRKGDEHLNGLVSKIMQWKQLAGEDTKFSLDQLKAANPSWPPSGTRKVNLYQEFNALPEAKKKALLHEIAGQEQAHAANAQLTIDTQFQVGRNLMMTYFGKSLPKERWASAPDLVDKFTQAVDQAMSADPGTKLVGDKSLEAMRKILNDDAVFQGALDMWMDTHVGVKELQEFYASRPGHQSMMRTGKYLARAYDAKGEQYTDAVQDMAEYTAWRDRLKSDGYVRFDEPQLIDQKNSFQLTDDTLNLLNGIEQRKQARIESMDLSEDLKAILSDAVNISGDVARMMASRDVRLPADMKGIQGGERRKIPGSMDMVESQKLFYNVSTRLNANRQMKTRLAYELSNPELTRFPQEVESFKRQVENYMRPDSSVSRALMRTNSVMFLGGNLSSIMMNMMQTPMTALPELLNRGISSFKALGLLSGAVKDVGEFSAHLLAEKVGLYDEHKAIKKMKNQDEQMFMSWANHEGLLSVSSLAELSDLNADAAIDLNRIGDTERPMKPAEKAKSAISNFANFSMKGFAASEQFNKRIALLLGYRAAKETLGANAPKEELYKAASDFMYATTYAGGRANRPLLQGDTGVFGAAAYSLSGYTMGWLNQVARYVQHWKGAEYLNLRPEERSQARKAALSMLGIQVGAAGLMGLPFAGAMLKVMEKITGENLQGQIYQKLGALFDQDDEEGGGLGKTVMEGLANSALAASGMPVDVGSRWGLSSTLGFNSFDGFNGDSVFGPTGSLVASALAGMKSSFQGDFGAAAKQFAPAAIKKAVSYYVNGGQAETSKGSMVEMGDAETLGYIVGFNSQKLAALQKYRGIEIAQEEANALDRAKETNEILNLLQTNPIAAQQKVQTIVSNGGGVESHAQVARRVAEAAAEKVYPKDVRATAGKKSGDFLMDVAQTMNVPIPQANQVARRSYIDQVMMMLGARPQRQSRRERSRDDRLDQLGNEYTPFQSVR